MWERRYAAVEPTRSAGNQRLYTDEDVARFRLLAAATSTGRSIRTVASLATATLEELVAGDTKMEETLRDAGNASADASVLATALAFTMSLDAAGLDAALRRSVAVRGLRLFLEVDAPALMRRVGDDWEAGRMSVAQEHLASAAVLNIALDTVRALPVTPSAPRLLVATLSQERHGVGAALAAAVAALEGWAIVHLGVDVPSTDIGEAATTSGARAVALSIVYDDNRAQVLREVAKVRKAASRLPLIVGGAAAVLLSAKLAALGAIVCRDLVDFRATLARESLLVNKDAP